MPPGSWDGEVIDAIKPLADEIVIPKTVVERLRLDQYRLRAAGTSDTKYLVISGVVTDQCVEGAVRDGLRPGLPGDADHRRLRHLFSRERHENSLRAIKGYCRQRTTDEFLKEIGAAN